MGGMCQISHSQGGNSTTDVVFELCVPPAEGKLLENCLVLIHTAQNPFVLAGLGAILIYSLSCKLLLACEILIY